MINNRVTRSDRVTSSLESKEFNFCRYDLSGTITRCAVKNRVPRSRHFWKKEKFVEQGSKYL